MARNTEELHPEAAAWLNENRERLFDHTHPVNVELNGLTATTAAEIANLQGQAGANGFGHPHEMLVAPILCAPGEIPPPAVKVTEKIEINLVPGFDLMVTNVKTRDL